MTNKKNLLRAIAIACLLTITAGPQASADMIFDTFDEHAHSFSGSGSSLSAGEISTITALGASAGSAHREIVAAPGTVTIDTANGGKYIGVGNYTQYRYGSITTAANHLNLDLSAFDGFEIDVLSVSGSTTPFFSFQFTTNNATEHRFTSNTSITAAGTYTIPWSDLTGGAGVPTANDLMDVDGLIVINTFHSGSGTLEVGELRLFGGATVPEPSAAMTFGLLSACCLFRRRRRCAQL